MSWAHIAPSAADSAAPSGNPTTATDAATSATTAPSGATSATGAASATAAGLQSFSSASAHQVTPIPMLERCLSHQDDVPGYWSYLMNQYPTIPYVVGKDIDMPFNPQSAILLYILEKESFLHDDLVPDEIPHEDIFTRQIYFDHAPDTPVDPSEERRIISAYRERGLEANVVRWDMEIETKRLYDFRAGCQELVSWFESSKCPLWNEYVAIKGYYDSLKKKITLLNEDFLSA